MLKKLLHKVPAITYKKKQLVLTNNFSRDKINPLDSSFISSSEVLITLQVTVKATLLVTMKL